MRLICVTVLVVLTTSAGALADAKRDKAQIDMIQRVSGDVDAYAKSIGLDASAVSFCHSSMLLETTTYPPNNLVPFGVNYNTADDRTFEATLVARESFETLYQKLCLADIKAKFKAALP